MLNLNYLPLDPLNLMIAVNDQPLRGVQLRRKHVCWPEHAIHDTEGVEEHPGNAMLTSFVGYGFRVSPLWNCIVG